MKNLSERSGKCLQNILFYKGKSPQTKQVKDMNRQFIKVIQVINKHTAKMFNLINMERKHINLTC